MEENLENFTLEQWLALLLGTENHTKNTVVTEVLLQDSMVWNSLQTFLQLLTKSCQEHHQAIASDSLLVMLVQQGYKNPSINLPTVVPSVPNMSQGLQAVSTELPNKNVDEDENQTIQATISPLEDKPPSNSHADDDCENKVNPSQCENVPDLAHTSISLNVHALPNFRTLPNREIASSNQTLSLSPEPKSHKMPNFQLPNAKVNQLYHAYIKSTQSPEVKFTLLDITLPPELGMIFNADDHSISGIPQISGEFELKFNYKTLANESLSDSCLFIVNPDPASLWQMNEPDSTLPYPKPHQDTLLIERTAYNLVAVSRRGRSHEHAGSFRDDDFYISSVDDFTDWSILMVADGAGSASYSREGSRLAVSETATVLQNRLGEILPHINTILAQVSVGQSDDSSQQAYQKINALLNPLFQEAITTALQAIENEASTTNREVKDFSTTLLVALVRQLQEQTFIISFWVGDGAIAVYAEDKVRLMGKPDGGQYAGQTHFLTRNVLSDLNERMRLGFYDNVKAVILMTDGISDPKFETDAGLEQQERWDNLWAEIEPLLKEQSLEPALLDWMHFLIPGHHDDRTLAIMYPKPPQLPSPWLTHHETLPLATDHTLYPLTASPPSTVTVDLSQANLDKGAN